MAKGYARDKGNPCPKCGTEMSVNIYGFEPMCVNLNCKNEERERFIKHLNKTSEPRKAKFEWEKDLEEEDTIKVKTIERWSTKDIEKEQFINHLNKASKIVEQWPEWKQTIFGGKVENPDSHLHIPCSKCGEYLQQNVTGFPIMEYHCANKNCPEFKWDKEMCKMEDSTMLENNSDDCNRCTSIDCVASPEFGKPTQITFEEYCSGALNQMITELPEHNDSINHPSHYNKGKIEVIEFIEDQDTGYHLSNVLKYVCRSPHKGNEIDDLKKAKWYLERKIKILQGDNANETNDSNII